MLWPDTTLFDWPGPSELLARHCPSDDVELLTADVAAEVSGAVICTTDIRTVAGDGSWRIAVVTEVTGGLDQLLTTYAVPDQETPAPEACTADWQDPGHVWLQTAGGVIAVRAPVDPCHKPLEDAATAFHALVTAPVGEEPVEQTATELSVATSCPDDWLDVLAMPELRDEPTSAAPWTLPDQGTFVCTYRRDGDLTGHGRLVAGARLDRAESATVNDALGRSTSDATCDPDAGTHFVVLGATTGFVQHTYVDLDGCAVQQNRSWWRATDDLRALLS